MVTRVAPLAARPARQLSIADFAVGRIVAKTPQGKAFCARKTAPPSTLVSIRSISKNKKRTTKGAFLFLEQVKGVVVSTLPTPSKLIFLRGFEGF